MRRNLDAGQISTSDDYAVSRKRRRPSHRATTATQKTPPLLRDRRSHRLSNCFASANARPPRPLLDRAVQSCKAGMPPPATPADFGQFVGFDGCGRD